MARQHKAGIGKARRDKAIQGVARESKARLVKARLG
jgi:hypothetical protein